MQGYAQISAGHDFENDMHKLQTTGELGKWQSSVLHATRTHIYPIVGKLRPSIACLSFAIIPALCRSTA